MYLCIGVFYSVCCCCCCFFFLSLFIFSTSFVRAIVLMPFYSMIFYSNMPGISFSWTKKNHSQTEREKEQIEPEIKCKKNYKRTIKADDGSFKNFERIVNRQWRCDDDDDAFIYIIRMILTFRTLFFRLFPPFVKRLLFVLRFVFFLFFYLAFIILSIVWIESSFSFAYFFFAFRLILVWFFFVIENFAISLLFRVSSSFRYDGLIYLLFRWP